jgi:predicted metal-dependent phosphoesterase TrpH
MKAIIHVHSRYSFDCLTSPEKLVDMAVKNGIDVLCITDHDTLQGSIQALEYAQKRYGDALKIIIGAEYKTDCGDIIGLNLKEEIYLKKAEEVIKAIKQQGGLVLLPHPFVSHKNIDFLAEQADAIEVFNARTSPEANQKAFELAQTHNKSQYVASDAHFLADAALCINQFHTDVNTPFEEALMHANRTFTHGFSSRKHYFQSQIIGGFKKRNVRLMLSAAKNLLPNFNR